MQAFNALIYHFAILFFRDIVDIWQFDAFQEQKHEALVIANIFNAEFILTRHSCITIKALNIIFIAGILL